MLPQENSPVDVPHLYFSLLSGNYSQQGLEPNELNWGAQPINRDQQGILDMTQSHVSLCHAHILLAGSIRSQLDLGYLFIFGSHLIGRKENSCVLLPRVCSC